MEFEIFEASRKFIKQFFKLICKLGPQKILELPVVNSSSSNKIFCLNDQAHDMYQFQGFRT